MIKLNNGDYVKGIEKVGYGNTVNEMHGWVDRVTTDKNGLAVVSIQCDDEYGGYRGSMLREAYGEIEVLEDKQRPVTSR